MNQSLVKNSSYVLGMNLKEKSSGLSRQVVPLAAQETSTSIIICYVPVSIRLVYMRFSSKEFSHRVQNNL